MTRIIAGAAKGRQLRVPPGSGTRPTSDRVREALFGSLDAMVAPWARRRVVDLYAGSGALGLEAASRGAGHVLLVESDRRAAAIVRRNVATVGVGDVVVVAKAVEAVLRIPPTEPYDVVLLDPPYALPQADLTAVFERLVGAGWLANDAVIVVERDRRSAPPTWPAGIQLTRERRYGETCLYVAHPVTP